MLSRERGMRDKDEEIVVNELSRIFGREYALMLLELEKERSGSDIKKLVGGIRGLMVKAGGERFGEMIYSRLQSKLGWQH